MDLEHVANVLLEAGVLGEDGSVNGDREAAHGRLESAGGLGERWRSQRRSEPPLS